MKKPVAPQRTLIHPSALILHPFKMVEAPRIELGSKSCRRKTLHAYSLLLPSSQAARFSLSAESVKRQDLGAS